MTRIGGRRRRLFVNRGEGAIGIVAIGKRKRGYVFHDWQAIEKVYLPTEDCKAEEERKRILKYQRLAQSATFHNAWLRDIAKADLSKSLYENHITTGTAIDGKCPHCGGEIRVGNRAFNCTNYKDEANPCKFSIWRNIGGHQLTLDEVKEICESSMTNSELEMYRDDGAIYHKRLGLSPDKLQIIKI